MVGEHVRLDGPAEAGPRRGGGPRTGPARSLGGLVSTRDVFSGQELARLRGFPEISREELIRFFTLSAADEAFVRSMRRPATVLGVAVQLCALPWLGFVPDEVGAAPVVAPTCQAEVRRPGAPGDDRGA